MPQVTIDPRNLGAVSDSVSIKQVAESAARFGFVPDLKHCRAGDLILSHSVKPSFIESLITRTQKKAGFGAEDSCWTHAAVFLYEDFILEADPWKGVVTRSFYSDVPGTVFRVRRRPRLEDEVRYKIALCAQRMLGTRYSMVAALSLGWRASSGMWDQLWYPTFSPVIICSKVFYDAHVEITRTLLTGCPIADLVMPSHLSATIDLDDIPMPWLKLV